MKSGKKNSGSHSVAAPKNKKAPTTAKKDQTQRVSAGCHPVQRRGYRAPAPSGCG